MRFMSALVLLAVIAAVAATRADAQDWRTVTSLRQYKGEGSLRVDLEYGAGRLNIAPGDAGSLYKATLRYDADHFKPVTQYADGRLKVGIEGGHVRGRMRSGRLDLTLGTRVPLDLDLQFGAAQADVELGGLKIRGAHIATGASETHVNVATANPESCGALKLEVGAASFEAAGLGNLNCERVDVDGGVGDVSLDFNGAWRVNSEVTVDMGLGSLTVRVPRGLGVQVHKTGFLASFDSQGLVKRGNTYYSENWDQASNRVTFNIDAAFGSIRIEWVEPTAEFRRAQR
jgi:hypothetical protein